MDAVFGWLSDNRDAVIVGVVVIMVAVLGKWAKATFTYRLLRLQGWIAQRRLKQEQKKEKEKREEEQRLCKQRFVEESSPPPHTDAGQVTVGALLDTGWEFVDESEDQEFVVLSFVTGRGLNGHVPPGVALPVLRAAQKYHSGAEVVWRRSLDNSQMYPYGHLNLGIRVSRTPN